MSSIRYEGKKGQEILLNDEEVIIQKKGNIVSSFSFKDYHLRVGEKSSIGVFTYLFGMLGALISSMLTAGHCLYAISLTGKDEHVNLFLNKNDVADLKENIIIRNRQLRDQLRETTGKNYIFKGNSAASYIISLLFLWLFFGGIAITLFVLLGTNANTTISYIGFITSGGFLALLIWLTFIIVKQNKNIIKTLKFTTGTVTINDQSFALSSITDLKTTPEDSDVTNLTIAFKSDGAKYKYSIVPQHQKKVFNAAYANSEYLEIMDFFRITVPGFN